MGWVRLKPTTLLGTGFSQHQRGDFHAFVENCGAREALHVCSFSCMTFRRITCLCVKFGMCATLIYFFLQQESSVEDVSSSSIDLCDVQALHVENNRATRRVHVGHIGIDVFQFRISLANIRIDFISKRCSNGTFVVVTQSIE